MSKDLKTWMSNLCDNIENYSFYVDFERIYKKVEDIKIELNILNALIGSKDIEKDFENIVEKYPSVLKCIPVLLAVRQSQIGTRDIDGVNVYDFKNFNYSIEQYKVFMRKTGLFDLISNHIINNLIDYVLGVEVGLDTNARKNRRGALLENYVEEILKNWGIEKYYKNMCLEEIEEKWNIKFNYDYKRFDFVIKTNNMVYGIDVMFFSLSGTKLKEVIKNSKEQFNNFENVDGFEYLQVLDGSGWKYMQNELRELFEITDNVYNIKEFEELRWKFKK